MCFFTRLTILSLLAFSVMSGKTYAQGCSCTDCPQYLPDLFQGNFNISVQGAANNILGQNGQGVCAVHLHFNHEYLGDLQIILTAPSGQTDTLVGPLGLFGATTFTNWDVTFVRCSDLAMPTSGFNSVWDNGQNWGTFGDYMGSYYPHTGCLEDFNTGPVNGTWTLTIQDNQKNDTGNLLGWEIVFCDHTGINCFSCAADAGNLLQPDLEACKGDSSLNLNLPPDYNAPAVPPSSAMYSYTYLIGNEAGTIETITAVADLRTFQAGSYSVCGLSYYTADAVSIPGPDGLLTIAQLSAELNSPQPPFCGNVTSNCVNVIIDAIPPDTVASVAICAPACFDFFGQIYCQSGDYTVIQSSQNGCDYQATLHLIVHQPTTDTIRAFLCQGDCFVHPAFPIVCQTGTYQATLINQAGCDSLLVLQLTIINVQAAIAVPDTLRCTQPVVQLKGSGSGSGGMYHWMAGNGGHIIGSVDSVIALVDHAGTYLLRVCDLQGGTSCCDSATVYVVSTQKPVDIPPLPEGSQQVCANDTFGYMISFLANADSYEWKTTSAAAIKSGQGSNSVGICWNVAGTDSVCVRSVSICGNSPFICLPVTIRSVPALPVITGNILVCRGDTVMYTGNAQTQVYWQVTGGSILHGNGTDTIQVLWNSNAVTGMVCANAANTCGQSGSACINVDIHTKPAQPVISGDAALCAGVDGHYSVAPINGATGYTWTVPAGAKIVSGQHTASVVVNWGSTAGGDICATADNTCGASQPVCFTVVVYNQPVANAGADGAVCSLSFGLSATASVAGSSGAWLVVTGPGPVSFSNAGAASNTTTAAQYGIYQFSWTETNGVCKSTDTVTVHFNETPAAGQIQHACDGSNQNYTVSFPITGGTAPYIIPGGTVSGGVFTSASVVSGQPFTFAITDANGCQATTVSGTFNCNCSTSAGQMNLAMLSACPGSSVTAQQTGGNLDANDTGGFFLHTNSGTSLGTVLAQNASGTFSFGNGMVYGTTYYISYVAGNNLNGFPDLADPCLSVAQGQPVAFFDNPAANAGADTAGCGLTLALHGNTGSGNGSWTISNVPVGGSALIASPNSAVTDVTATGYGAYTFTYTVSNNGCTGSDNVICTFSDPPVVNAITWNCDSLNQYYTIRFTVSGGKAPYTVAGLTGIFAGNKFTSDLLPGNSSYHFRVVDANGCVSGDVDGSHSCNCATHAGTMDTKPLIICADQPAVAIWNNNAVLDADDTIGFVLHDQWGGALGNVFAAGSSPQFYFGPGLQTGVTYYIAAIAGNKQNGMVDTGDPCLDVAPGTPVQWKPLPVAGLTGDSVICAGGTAVLTFTGSGIYPLHIMWTDGSGTPAYLIIPDQMPVQVSRNPVNTTVYSILAVTDGTNPACSAKANGSWTVQVSQPVHAGIPNAPRHVCAGLNEAVQVGDLLDGADPGGVWSEVSAVPSTSGAFDAASGVFHTSGQVKGTYTFRYGVQATPPCSVQESTVSVILDAAPVADAGTDQVIACNQPEVELGGPATSGGKGHLYSWIYNGNGVGSSIHLQVDQPGTYILEVENAMNCKARDTVLVTADKAGPKANFIKISGIRCHGDQDGKISIDSITSSHNPVLISLNGSPFNSNSIFYTLKPGKYVVTLQDAFGCEWTSDTLFIQEPPELFVKLGSTFEAALGDSVYLDAWISVLPAAIQSILWNPVLDTLHADAPFQHFLAVESKQVSIQVTDTSGCMASGQASVIVSKQRAVYIPNIFSPGRVANERLTVYGGKEVEEVESFQIYDRWGSIMFEIFNVPPNEPLVGWNGKSKGKEVPGGVYVYCAAVRFADGRKVIYRGDVTVLR
jgi:subtilisin-like proprotein convertase family protein